jgi:5-methylcytosine-specific restriction endonuclease McrA
MTTHQFTLDFSNVKICTNCCKAKVSTDFALAGKKKYGLERRQAQCKLCKNAKRVILYRDNEELRKKFYEHSKARYEKLRSNEEYLEKLYKRKREYRQKLVDSGLTTNGTPRIIFSKPTPEQVALLTVGTLYRKWHRNWLKTLAPVPCVAAIYTATGKPWNNPRLNEGQKFAMRYELDTKFRAKQILKTQGRNAKRAALIAAQSDGTVTYKTLGALFAGSKDCCYCGAPLTARQKTADHIVPLTQGGLHSMTNLAICCISCNSSKQDRTPEQWLTSGLQKSRWTALISSKQPTFSA